MENVSLVVDSSLKLIPARSRSLFFWLILTITVVTVIGNFFAIVSVIRRKQKCLLKICIISLSLADIFSVTMFATNNLDALSRELKIWKLGEFLCHFIPMGQVLGTTASSIAVLVIALDRYQNVTIAIISERWNPNIWKCLIVVVICAIGCSVMSYPMYVFFTYNPIEVVHTSGSVPVFEYAFLCAAIDKDKLKWYYIIMTLIIFLPVAVIFIWFYYQIAAMIWRHRKPFMVKYYPPKSNPSVVFTKRTKTAQVQRKLRTFKVVIVLMVVFIVCRLPYWAYFVLKLVETIKGSTMWYVNFTLIALNMLNCALNPFLYAFLNQTTHAARKCHNFSCKVALYCSCFTSRNFENFQKHNPLADNHENKIGVGLKKSENNFKIRFVDVSHLPMHADAHLNKLV